MKPTSLKGLLLSRWAVYVTVLALIAAIQQLIIWMDVGRHLSERIEQWMPYAGSMLSRTLSDINAYFHAREDAYLSAHRAVADALRADPSAEPSTLSRLAQPWLLPGEHMEARLLGAGDPAMRPFDELPCDEAALLADPCAAYPLITPDGRSIRWLALSRLPGADRLLETTFRTDAMDALLRSAHAGADDAHTPFALTLWLIARNTRTDRVSVLPFIGTGHLSAPAPPSNVVLRAAHDRSSAHDMVVDGMVWRSYYAPLPERLGRLFHWPAYALTPVVRVTMEAPARKQFVGYAIWTFLPLMTLFGILGALAYQSVAERFVRPFRRALHFIERSEPIPQEPELAGSLELRLLRDRFNEHLAGEQKAVVRLQTASHQLEDQRNLLQQVLDTNPHCIFAKDREGRYTLVNRAMSERHGIPAETMIGRTDAELHVVAEHVSRVRRDDQDVVRQGQEKVIEEETIRTLRGETLIVQTVKRPLYDDRGRVAQVLGVSTDITERKRVEAERALQENLLMAIADNLSIAIFAMDHEARFTMANRALARLVGLRDASELLGKTDKDLFADYPAQGASFHEVNLRILREGRGFSDVEGAFSSPTDGTPRWVRTTKVPLKNALGEIVGLVGLTQDLSTFKEAEAELERRVNERTAEVREREAKWRALFEAARAASFAIMDATSGNLAILECNPATTTLFGYARDELLGRSALLVSRPEDAGFFLGLLSNMHATGEGFDGEVTLIRKGGTPFTAFLSAHPLRDENGALSRVVCVTIDISRRKQAEDELKRRDRILRAVSFAAEQFLLPGSWDQRIALILERLGGAAEVSRIFIFENEAGGRDRLYMRCRHMWLSDGASDAPLPPERDTYASAGLSRWAQTMRARGLVTGVLDALPEDERRSLEPLGVRSIAAIPIFMGNRWWGYIGFSQLDRERVWSEAELDALRALADILGSALLNREAERTVREHAEGLRELASQLVLSEERERRELAADLHDSVGSALTIANFKLDTLCGRARDEASRSLAMGLQDLLLQIIGRTRTLTFQLSPPTLYQLGLAPTLEAFAGQATRLHGVEVSFVCEDPEPPLPEDRRVLLYRATRELVINVIKHAEAKRARIVMQTFQNVLRIDVTDNGRGFRVDDASKRSGGFGLFSIRERLRSIGGRLVMRSKPGRGTWAVLTLPL